MMNRNDFISFSPKVMYLFGRPFLSCWFSLYTLKFGAAFLFVGHCHQHGVGVLTFATFFFG